MLFVLLCMMCFTTVVFFLIFFRVILMKKHEGILSTLLFPAGRRFGYEYFRSVSTVISLSKSFIVGQHSSGILPALAGEAIFMGVRLLDDRACAAGLSPCF